MLAPRQLAINAALESLFGHEINSELASIIRGWISRRSSTRRVEREEREKKKKKKKKIQRCFFLHAFLPTTSTSNKRASKHTFPWNLADPLLQPRNLDHAYFLALEAGQFLEDFWRPRFCQIFSLEKIIRVNLISPLVACFPFTILKRFQVQPDPLFKRLLKVCQVVRPCFFVT